MSIPNQGTKQPWQDEAALDAWLMYVAGARLIYPRIDTIGVNPEAMYYWLSELKKLREYVELLEAEEEEERHRLESEAR